MILEVPFLTDLHERFMKSMVLLQLVQGTHLPFEGTGAVFSTEYIHPKKSHTVVSSKTYSELSERLISWRCFSDPGIVLYSQLDGVGMVKQNHEDICVRVSDYCVFVSKGSGVMEVQHHSRRISLFLVLDSGEFTDLNLKHKGPQALESWGNN